MRKSALWLTLCLSSLLVTVSLVTATTVKTSAISNTAIAQANPCAGKNPCASKKANIGRPLAKELQGKPVVVDIYATWCSKCKNIAPTLSQLKQQYAGKVHFVVLDVSDKSTSTQAEAKAKKLGLSEFFATNKTQTGMLTIIDPATGNILAQHRNNADKSAYTTVLDQAIAKK
ncbi:thioredoxin [Oscillatoriales cyanobacterium USR001]|nr:thioredoxin [Oscillatoriales cyanobacterium USR001]